MSEATAHERNAWLLLTVGEDRQHGGNDGYDDQPDVHYAWDSTVPNAKRLQPGDPIALWDGQRLLGISIIESIDVGTAEKLLHRCSNCGMAQIRVRKTKRPRYRCSECGQEFDVPMTTVEGVTTYRSRHDAGWTDLNGLLTATELRALCHSPKSQLSLRPLRWDTFMTLVRERVGDHGTVATRRRDEPEAWGGHVMATVRVRVGQGAFRRRLLESTGALCAFTGPAPEVALEAGHLYSYAELGVHHKHGGLLLRRDIHRLFDAGLIAVRPDTLTIDVTRTIMQYPQYETLHGRHLQVMLSEEQVKWLKQHWAQHRGPGGATTATERPSACASRSIIATRRV